MVLEPADAAFLNRHGNAEAVGDRLEMHRCGARSLKGLAHGIDGLLVRETALPHRLQLLAHIFCEDLAAPALERVDLGRQLIEAFGHHTPVRGQLRLRLLDVAVQQLQLRVDLSVVDYLTG